MWLDFYLNVGMDLVELDRFNALAINQVPSAHFTRI